MWLRLHWDYIENINYAHCGKRSCVFSTHTIVFIDIRTSINFCISACNNGQIAKLLHIFFHSFISSLYLSLCQLWFLVFSSLFVMNTLTRDIRVKLWCAPFLSTSAESLIYQYIGCRLELNFPFPTRIIFLLVAIVFIYHFIRTFYN